MVVRLWKSSEVIVMISRMNKLRMIVPGLILVLTIFMVGCDLKDGESKNGNPYEVIGGRR